MDFVNGRTHTVCTTDKPFEFRFHTACVTYKTHVERIERPHDTFHPSIVYMLQHHNFLIIVNAVTTMGDMQLAVNVLQANFNIIYANLVLQRLRHRRQRRWWTRPWLTLQRRVHFGLYDQLMTELRAEHEGSFQNFMRMPPRMFDEILQRVAPRLTKQDTNYRRSLPPGLKLALTLRHLASGSKYTDMQYGWRVPNSTISLFVREVRSCINIFVRFEIKYSFSCC